MKKTILSLALAAALILGAATQARTGAFSLIATASAATEAADFALSDYFTKRDLAGTWDEKDAVALNLTGSVAIT